MELKVVYSNEIGGLMKLIYFFIGGWVGFVIAFCLFGILGSNKEVLSSGKNPDGKPKGPRAKQVKK